MKNYLLLVLNILFLSGCTKQDYPYLGETPKPDYTKFLASKNMEFSGKFQQYEFSWPYGFEYQANAGFQNPGGGCDSGNPFRVAIFALVTNDATTWFRLCSPTYYSPTFKQDYLDAMFKPGLRQLGSRGENFSLEIFKDNNYYVSYDNSPQSKIEIMKTEKFKDGYGESRIRVWFLVNAILKTNGDESKPAPIKEGLMVANFWGF
jgi:hypothetical protein